MEFSSTLFTLIFSAFRVLHSEEFIPKKIEKKLIIKLCQHYSYENNKMSLTVTTSLQFFNRNWIILENEYCLNPRLQTVLDLTDRHLLSSLPLYQQHPYSSD